MAVTCDRTSAYRTMEALVRNSAPDKLRTAVVDDSEDYADVICELLEMENVVEVVARASNGADAIYMAAHFEPDLLLMDVNMPLVDGIAAASFIAQHLPRTKIVLMSADGSPEMQTACLASGASAFIHKPKFREEFLRTVYEICGEAPPATVGAIRLAARETQ